MAKSEDREKKDKNNKEDDSIKEMPELEVSSEIHKVEEEGLDTLKEELEIKKKELDEFQNKYLRLYAEFENFKKVTSKEQSELLRYGHERLITEILPVIDNLERAIAHSKEFINKINPEGTEALEGLISGVEMTLRQMLDVLCKFGVKEIKALGETFDPSRHHAVAQIETEECKPNTVTEELRKGYLLHDRVIRPSMVAVSKSPEPQVSNEQSEVGSLESDEGD